MVPKRKVKTEGKPSDKKQGPGGTTKVECAVHSTSDDNSGLEEALDSSKYSSRKLSSNWKKYDDEVNLVSESRGLNFSDFSKQKPTTSTDSYFRFSSEKNWEVLDKFDDYFKLNVNDLCREIMCLPLHERLKLEPCLLTAEQIEMFDSDAKMYESRMKEPLAPTKNITGKMLSLLTTGIESKDEAKSCSTGWHHPDEEFADKQQKTWDNNCENFFSLSGVEEELDLILAMPTMALPSNAPDVSSNTEDVSEESSVIHSNLELQNDWLDSLLDED
ncbi:uncharacterized protein LOC130701059 [Daphnia carinata]|uniref:uncharacterized protein LOC130701059 n=1 Tax=Daphnia carinata TaxID=120202 RepID=UPI00257A6194|nr:uncharacterized protein LOC130701059 [Daphnia carinata]